MKLAHQLQITLHNILYKKSPAQELNDSGDDDDDDNDDYIIMQVPMLSYLISILSGVVK